MKILVIGSGGREHTLIWKIAQSPLVERIYAAPGNAGIGELAECVPIEATDIEALCDFAKTAQIDLTIVGPELPLVEGIVDQFEEKHLRIFGPTKEAARLEGSKAFAKGLLDELGIPTAAFHTFTTVNDAKKFIVDEEPPFVIKADGLAQGKGVIIASTCEEGVHVVNQMIGQGLFGASGKTVIIEQFLSGDEISILVLTDGTRLIPLSSAQDHKRAFDGDQGPNTGGMGAYSPCPFVTDDELHSYVEQTAKPVIDALRKRGTPYKGILYVGLMLVQGKPYVLEFNVRFGDPETQAILPRLKSDIVPILFQIANGSLEIRKVEWDTRHSISVVMASGGYPGSYQKGFKINGIDSLDSGKDVFVFHAGTARNESGKVITDGGRVLAVSALGNSFREAHELAYQSLAKIKFEGGFYRHDIGKRVFEKTKVGG